MERWDLIDLRQERLRKSDHLNPLRDVPHLEAVAAATGFRIAKIRFYTPIVGGFVENIMMRVAERAMARRAAKRLPPSAGRRRRRGQARRAPPPSKGSRAARPPMRRCAACRSLMKLDLLLFGRITSGPFFALLVKDK